MVVIGLTGGMGAGKSTLTPWLKSLGWVVIDADQLARDVVAPGTDGLAEVVSLLGHTILDDQGNLQRAMVADLVFPNPELLVEYQSIVHRYIGLEKCAQMTALAAKDPHVKLVYIAPLLFEAHLQTQFQKTVLVELSVAQQKQRLIQGRKMSAEDVDRRLAAQMPLEEKRQLADFVVDNNGPLDQTQSQVTSLFAKLATLPPWTLDQALGNR